MTAEQQRLEESRDRKSHWKRWGPCLRERAWGTVREDYSPHTLPSRMCMGSCPKKITRQMRPRKLSHWNKTALSRNVDAGSAAQRR
jgi:hypothetical protein